MFNILIIIIQKSVIRNLLTLGQPKHQPFTTTIQQLK